MIEKTQRGFSLYKFKDFNNIECSIQKSSIATEDCIWIGSTDINLQRFDAGIGWSNVELANTEKHHFIASNRMHLTQEQVRELLPILQKFADTGDL